MTARRIIVPGAMPSRDQNGRNLPGLLRFYEPDAAYTTLKAVYTTEDLDVPYAQPIASDAAGRFPQMWADEAEEFDVAWSDQTFDKRIATYANLTPADDAVLASVALAESAAEDAEDAKEAAEAAQAAAEEARDEAQAAAGAAVSASTIIGTRADAMLLRIPDSLESLQTSGYATPGDNGGALYVRVDAEPSHEGKFQSADGGWWEMAGLDWHVAAFGADLTGTTDATAAFDDAFAAMKAVNVGGGQIRWSGTPKVNLVINTDGITIRGPGSVNNQLPPTGNYLQPWDDADPVVQFGDDSRATTGSFLRDSMVRGNNTGMYGVVFAGGSYKNGATNVQILEVRHALTFESGASHPCVYNIVSDAQLSASGDACTGIQFIESGTYCTANAVIGYYVQFGTGWGWTVRVDSAFSNYVVGGWQQGGVIGGVLIESNGATTPTLFLDNSSIEATSKTLMAFKGDDLQDASFAASGKIWGRYEVNNNKSFFATKTTTTGTIAGGSLGTLALTSATGAWAGRAVLIFGAGSSGIPHFTTIADISGTTATLTDAAATAVTGATVWIGDARADDLLSEQYGFPDALRTAPVGPSVGPGLYRSQAQGSIAPFSGYDPVFELGSNTLYFLAQDTAQTVSSIARVGTTVTVTTSGTHNVATGDSVTILGALEAGFNGYFTATRTGNTTYTYTSPVSGNASATGTLSYRPFKRTTIGGTGLELPAGAGLRMRDQSGNSRSVLHQRIQGAALDMFTPDTTNGTMNVFLGSTQGSSGFTVDGGGLGSLFVVSTYGGVTIGGGSQNPSRRGAVRLYGDTTDPGQAVAADGVLFYAKSNALYYKNFGDTILRIQDTSSGATGSRPSSNLIVGQQYFDTTLGKPIWLKTVSGPVWVDAAGTTV